MLTKSSVLKIKGTKVCGSQPTQTPSDCKSMGTQTQEIDAIVSTQTADLRVYFF